MLTWFLVNVVISVLALVFITLSSNAPHRLRFLAGFAALVAWLVPWPLVPDLLPANMFSFELWRIERAVEASSTQLTGVFPVIVQTSAMPLARDVIILSVIELAFLALTLIGCVLFAWKVVAHRLLLRQLARQGGDGNWLWDRAGLVPACPVGIQRDIAGAFSSGLWRPRIWVHDDLVHSPQLATLLRHEVTHIQQYDNWYLLAITLVERLFWWNPLVWYLGRGTRDLLELSCDERCQNSNPDYPAQLAQLMIDSARGAGGPMTAQQPRMLALSANIFNTPNPNVRRIQLLQRSYPMLTRHILGAAVTAASAFLVVAFVTAQPDTADAPQYAEIRLRQGVAAPGAAGPDDQFMRADMLDGEMDISFQFTDVPLPAVLRPLVGMVIHGDVAGMSGMAPVELAVLHVLDDVSEPVYGKPVEQILPAERLVEVLKIKAEGGTTSWEQDGGVITVSAATSVQGTRAGIVDTRFVPTGPPSDNLVLEYPEAADRIVSVSISGENLTLDDAIELIAEQSGCNIFRDGDKIVVDFCEE